VLAARDSRAVTGSDFLTGREEDAAPLPNTTIRLTRPSGWPFVWPDRRVTGWFEVAPVERSAARRGGQAVRAEGVFSALPVNRRTAMNGPGRKRPALVSGCRPVKTGTDPPQRQGQVPVQA